MKIVMLSHGELGPAIMMANQCVKRLFKKGEKLA